MNVEIIYILLPLVCAVWALEEVVARRWWRKEKACRDPRLVAWAHTGASAGCVALVSLGEFAVALFCVAVFLGGVLWPLLALFYGFTARWLVRGVIIAFERVYTPGVVSLGVFAPYFAIGAANMLGRFPVSENFFFFAAGVLFVFADELLLHRLSRRSRRGSTGR